MIASTFGRGNDGVLLTLPIRNLDAPEVGAIATLCRQDILEPTFADALEANLKSLRGRIHPRPKSSYRTRYVVDHSKRYFHYGLERHAQFDTGGDHLPSCSLNGHFRFGRRIDAGRHYNVSETDGDVTSISGVFSNCHDMKIEVTRHFHLNMFANDFFGLLKKARAALRCGPSHKGESNAESFRCGSRSGQLAEIKIPVSPTSHPTS